MIDGLWKNLRYSLRGLLKSPGFTLVAVLSLALGIGTNAAVFSIIDAVLFRPYPYKDPEKLVVVRLLSSKSGLEDVPLSYRDYAAYKEKSRAFEDLAAIGYRSMNVGDRESAVRVRGVLVSQNLFGLVGTRVIQGRAFLPEEDRPGGEKVAVLGEQFWQTRLGGDPAVVGRPLSIDGVARTVVGIVAADSQLPAPNDAAVFLPLALDPGRESWESFNYFVLGRLRPGSSFDAARSETAEIARQIAAEHPAEREGWSARVITLRESRTGDDRPMLMIGFASAAFVLLIACVNVANLLVQRGTTKQRDLAVRTALGASRGRIISHLLTESALLAFFGAAAGLVLSVWLLRLTVGLLPPEDLPLYVDGFALNGRGLLYLLAVAAFTVLIFGLFPAWRASRPDLRTMISDGERGAGSPGRQRVRNWLVIVEVALSMVLLVICGLLLGSLYRMVNTDTGVDRHHTLLVDLLLPETRYGGDVERQAFYRKALEGVRSLPGLSGAAFADYVPFGSWGGTRIELEGLSADAVNALPPVALQTVTEGYFETLRQSLVSGRTLTQDDGRPEAPAVAVLNARAARQFFDGKDPLGQRIRLLTAGRDGKDDVWVTVVGVVENIRRRNLADTSSLDLYLPAGRLHWPDMVLLAHVDGDPMSVVSAVRARIQEVDPNLAVTDARTLDKVISDSFTVQRVASILCGVFAVFALFMAAVGMHGSLNYTVQQRTREIGIRMALGSEPGQVVRLVVKQVLGLVAIGLGLGLLLSFAAAKLLESALFGVGVSGLLVLLLVAVVLTGVGLLAAWLPARRASRVSPVITLRAG